MKEQKYILKKYDSFNLVHIFECGQCFRWNEQEDGSYTGVFKGNVLNVQKDGNTVIFKGLCNSNIKDVIQKASDSSELANLRHEAKAQAWMNEETSGKAVFDYMVSKGE